MLAGVFAAFDQVTSRSSLDASLASSGFWVSKCHIFKRIGIDGVIYHILMGLVKNALSFAKAITLDRIEIELGKVLFGILIKSSSLWPIITVLSSRPLLSFGLSPTAMMLN